VSIDKVFVKHICGSSFAPCTNYNHPMGFPVHDWADINGVNYTP